MFNEIKKNKNFINIKMKKDLKKILIIIIKNFNKSNKFNKFNN